MTRKELLGVCSGDMMDASMKPSAAPEETGMQYQMDKRMKAADGTTPMKSAHRGNVRRMEM